MSLFCVFVVGCLLFIPASVRAADSFANLASLGPAPGPVFPAGSLAVGNAGVIYGTSTTGGALGLGGAFSLSPPARHQTAWTLSAIHSFAMQEGTDPYGGLTVDAGGAVYGAAYRGGANNNGSIYRLSRAGGDWTETTLISFVGQADGGAPHGGLTIAGNGVLYGTTTAGGTNNTGVVFALAPPASGSTVWVETVLTAFPAHGGTGGVYPYGGVTRAKTGVLYGTTYAGGAAGCGTIYQLAPGSAGAPWLLTDLHDFACGAAGANPLGRLLLDATGALTGATSANGTAPGTVFRLTPVPQPAPWRFATLFVFTGGAGGAAPLGDLSLDKAGRIYGVASSGGAGSNGIAYMLAPGALPQGQWTETVLHDFAGPDGATPLTVTPYGSHALVGTTCCGGMAGDGTIFKVTW